MINELISDLAELEAPPDTVNIYAWDAADALQTLGNAIRRNNLALALTLALERGPDLLLVGEAPVTTVHDEPAFLSPVNRYCCPALNHYINLGLNGDLPWQPLMADFLVNRLRRLSIAS